VLITPARRVGDFLAFVFGNSSESASLQLSLQGNFLKKFLGMLLNCLFTGLQLVL
jgi:hypothetical protein